LAFDKGLAKAVRNMIPESVISLNTLRGSDKMPIQDVER